MGKAALVDVTLYLTKHYDRFSSTIENEQARRYHLLARDVESFVGHNVLDRSYHSRVDRLSAADDQKETTDALDYILQKQCDTLRRSALDNAENSPDAIPQRLEDLYSIVTRIFENDTDTAAGIEGFYTHMVPYKKKEAPFRDVMAKLAYDHYTEALENGEGDVTSTYETDDYRVFRRIFESLAFPHEEVERMMGEIKAVRSILQDNDQTSSDES